MANVFVPTLLILLLPGAYLAHRLGWWQRPRSRVGLMVAGLGITVLSLPWGGLDFQDIKRLNLLITAATALLLLLCALRIPWATERRRWALWPLAALAVINYFNYFDFHGERTFVHLHDVAHYYLGSKYYDELGYGDLYTAMLRAEAETHDNHFKAIEARDLVSYDRVHIRTLLQRSDPVKGAFSADRWTEFQADVDLFRQRLDQHYGTLLLDHGFNPTPVWALLGGGLAQQVPGGSDRGILLLTLLDPLLLLGLFVAIGRIFGVETMLLSVIFFCSTFGATFGWTGGAFLRYPWLVAVGLAFCCMHRKRYATAGALFALAASLRVFPVLFLVPLVARATWAWWHRGTPRARDRRLVAGGAAAGLVLFALTGLLPRGFHHWMDFHTNMQTHMANIAPNVVGSTEVLAFRPGANAKVTAEEFNALKVRRLGIYHAQRVALFLPLLVGVLWLSRRSTDLDAALLTVPLLLTGLSLAAYYYALLLCLLFAERRRDPHLALIFAAESAAYVLMLFEERDGVLFIYRTLLIGALSALLLLPRLHISNQRRASGGGPQETLS